MAPEVAGSSPVPRPKEVHVRDIGEAFFAAMYAQMVRDRDEHGLLQDWDMEDPWVWAWAKEDGLVPYHSRADG